MIYILQIELDHSIRISVGALGRIFFKKGIYFYVGSAKINLSSRLKRHLRKKKKKFWHIDYLTSDGSSKIKEVYLTDNFNECEMAELLKCRCEEMINNFGSSDCKCRAHLFFTPLEQSSKICVFLSRNTSLYNWKLKGL